MIQNTKPRPLVFTWRPHTLKSKEKRAIIIFNNNNNSGAPAREARVGQSPILMEYGQPLSVWLSRDWPSLRVYRLYGWGRGDYQKEGRGVSGVSLQVLIFYIGILNMVNWQLSKQDSHWPVSCDHIVGSCVNSSRWRDLFGNCSLTSLLFC